MKKDIINNLRLYSGLILFLFVTGHFLNLALGLISIDAMNEGAKVLLNPWHSTFGWLLLAGSFLVHIFISLWTLWARRTLRLKTSEKVQILLGLLAPIILFWHVYASNFVNEVESVVPIYYTTMGLLWGVFPWRGAIQAAAVLVVWIHGCIGINKRFQIQTKNNYVKMPASILAGAIPLMALVGYGVAGYRLLQETGQENWVQTLLVNASIDYWMFELADKRELLFQVGFVTFLLILFLGQLVRSYLAGRFIRPKITYFPGARKIDLIPGSTLLESLQAADIPHPSVCGGQGRCSTCRVKIGKGNHDLPPPTELETKVLSPGASSFPVRLACQLRPTKELEVTALVKSDGFKKRRRLENKNLPAREMDVVFLFVDIRNSTALSEERLPFDVVYILNLFFAEMADALHETNGHYAQFNGDGLMAIYGLNSGPVQGCCEAIEGAKVMFSKLRELNRLLESELPSGLKIGIGIHAGESVVGFMGPPDSPILSALGDNVNIAARLESLSKDYDVPLILSTVVAERSGLNVDRFPTHSITVKGRNRMVEIKAIKDPHLLSFQKMEAFSGS